MILLLRKRTLLYAGMLVCCLAGFAAVYRAGYARMALPAAGSAGEKPPAVIIDPGHGGQDGGAVAEDGTAESAINLAVSLRLEQLLRFAGVPTDMTRRTDEMVCDANLATMRQRKVSDIYNRVQMVNDCPGAVLLSIHQNSLPSSPETHGAQAFWNREAGAEELAGLLQAELNTAVNTHRAKEPRKIPETIYLMNHVTAPAVLVECGFLSNQEETACLKQAEYQMKLAAVIAAGYLQWAAGAEVP